MKPKTAHSILHVRFEDTGQRAMVSYTDIKQDSELWMVGIQSSELVSYTDIKQDSELWMVGIRAQNCQVPLVLQKVHWQ